jgi:alpha-1,3-rhamnosyl/mannosyltransferase
MPELHTRANLRADRDFAARVLTRATALIAVSESTRRDAVEYLRVPPERIVTIHSGVAEAFFQVSEEEARAVAERLALAKPYVLFVGTLEPRKNLDRLLDAWLALPGDLRQAYDLAIAGPAGWAAPATLARLDSISSSVRRLGYVPESDLPALTRGAALGVYPSLYEGFGFFVAQAMACGVAVLTSNVSSLPEIGGDGCVYIDPLSRGELAAALRTLLESPARREQLGARGRALAEERYRWSQCARRSLEFFRSLGAL